MAGMKKAPGREAGAEWLTDWICELCSALNMNIASLNHDGFEFVGICIPDFFRGPDDNGAAEVT